jgi:hypothetical protein
VPRDSLMLRVDWSWYEARCFLSEEMHANSIVQPGGIDAHVHLGQLKTPGLNC